MTNAITVVAQDMFRNFAETTGFAVKPIAPPALPAEDERGAVLLIMVRE